jgi:hypothetical protein
MAAKIYLIKKYVIFILLFFYVLLNLFYIDSFPFVHSDEAWLASLTRSIITEKNPGATEEFFRITERNPHAVKLLFHIIQIPFVKMKFSINSVRLLSVITSAVILCFLYSVIKKYIVSNFIRIITMLLIITDIQFIYISRLARQEIIIYLFAAAQLLIITKINNKNINRQILSASIFSGLSIFIHPNSFIIFTGIIPFLLYSNISKNYKLSVILKTTLMYIFITLFFAVIVLFLSYLMDPFFLKNYYNFGSSHGVGDSLFIKILSFPRFLYKLYHQISGTYYLPDVRFQFLIFASVLIIAPFIMFIVEKSTTRLLPIIIFTTGISAGIVIIGKYSPPSIFFIFPGLWILLGTEADIIINRTEGTEEEAIINMKEGTEANNFNKKKHIKKINIKNVYLPGIMYLFLSILLVYQLLSAYLQINIWKNTSYNDYCNEITALTTGNNGNILANTNMAFHIDYGRLCSYRDLGQVIDGKMTFDDYVDLNEIEYIIWTEELDIIAKERPLWNDLYGNVYRYHEEAIFFLNNNCNLIKTFSTNIYPVRIVDYMNKREYQVKVYKVTS